MRRSDGPAVTPWTTIESSTHGDARPDDAGRARRPRGAGVHGDRRRSTASRRRARRTRRRTPSRSGGPAASRRARPGRRAGARPRAAAPASSQPSQPGSPSPASVSIEPSSRITASSSSFSASSAPSCTRGVDLVVVLVAPEREPAGEHREEAVAARDLGEAVDHERGGDRVEAVERRRQQLAVAQALDAPRRGHADGGADRDAAGDRVDDVGGEPFADPVGAALARHEERRRARTATRARR